MSPCACKDRIQKLRNIMELTYDMYESFTNENVLAASQMLDDALIHYRKCPHYETCHSGGWGRPKDQRKESNVTPIKKVVG